MTERTIHLVGSIPLDNAAAVLDLAGSTLGDCCKRFPDGETGARKNWIGWQFPVFARQAALEQGETRERDYQLQPPFRFRSGRGADDLDFGELGFAAAALDSYALFLERRRNGRLPDEARFLVALPTPFAPVYSFTDYATQEAVYPVYEAAMLGEMQRICVHVPAADLAIQWDVATEMSIFEKLYPVPFEQPREVLTARLTKLGAAVPAGVELGYHLCYGSMNNRHWKEPDDLALCVAVANALSERIARRIDFLHMPVPIERSDDAYFAPLKQLRLATGTELFLGLLHDQDGEAGNAARIAAADKFVARFGLSTECGWGRRNREEVDAIMRMHAAMAGGADAA